MGKIKNIVCLILIILITLAAVGARIIGLSYSGLISLNHDEQIHLLTAQTIYQGTVSPREIWEGRKFLYIFYPWLSMYIVAGVYHLYSLLLGGYSLLAGWLLYLAGEGGGYLSNSLSSAGRPDSRTALYLGRLTIALIGAANIPLLYLVGKKLWNRRAGLLAAGILALNGYHVANCHWMKNDIVAAFFLTVAFFFAVRILIRGRIIDYIYSAVFAAIAVNTKHYGAPIVASCFFAHFLSRDRPTLRSWFGSLVSRKFLCFILVFLLIFVATYPLLYLDFGYIVSNFDELAARTESDAMFGTLGSRARARTFLQIRRDNLINFARFAWEMEAGIGPYVLLLGVGGIAAALWTRRKPLLLLASFPLIYLVAAIIVASPGVRYQDLIPLIPFFALLAAILICLIFQRLTEKIPWATTTSIMVAGIFLLCPYGRMVARMDYGYWERSIRYFASRWAARHIPPFSSVLRESKTISLDDSRYQTARVRALWNRDVESLAAAGADYLAVASRHERRALEETGLFGPEHRFGQFYLSLPDRYDLLKEFDLGVIPYRGGGSKIWQLRRDYPLIPGGIDSALLRRLQGDLSFSSPEILFPGPGGRCQGTTAFVVPPDGRIGRLIVSPVPLDRLGVQIINGDQPGTVRIRFGTEKLTEEFSAGEIRQSVVSPRTGFPFIHYSYRVSVSAPWNSPCLVRLLIDPYRIALGYLDIEDYARAIPFLEEAAQELPGDWYPRALLAAACRRTGRAEKAEIHRSEAEKIFPGAPAALAQLAGENLPLDLWEKGFEGLTGLSPRWLALRAGQTWYRDEWIEQGADDGRRVVIEEIHLPPGEYQIHLRGIGGEAAGQSGPLSIRIAYPGWDLDWEVSRGEDPPPLKFENRHRHGEGRLTIEGEAESISRLKEIVINPVIGNLRSRFTAYRRELEYEE